MFSSRREIQVYIIIIDKIENDLVVEVNLAAPYFVPGKKLYERVRWCLKDKLQLTFKFLMSWTKEGWSSCTLTVMLIILKPLLPQSEKWTLLRGDWLATVSDPDVFLRWDQNFCSPSGLTWETNKFSAFKENLNC